MTKENPRENFSNESTISRRTRYAFLIAVFFIFAAIVNIVNSLRLNISTQAIASYIDTFVIFVFLILMIVSAQKIRKGQGEKGIWLLLGSLVMTLALRGALIAGLGIIFSAISISLIPLIALMTLRRDSFNRALSLSIGAASFYIAYDFVISSFLPAYRLTAETAAPIIRATSIIAVLLVVAFVYTLSKQHQFILLSSKLTLAMVFLVLLPIVGLSFAGAISLRNSLEPRQNEIMEVKATLVAQSIESFITTYKRAVNAESQSPAIIEYLSIYNQSGLRSDGEPEEKALESLRSFRKKDILFISSYAILDISGKNILDTTSSNIGNDEGEASYFTQPLEKNLPFASDVIRPAFSDSYFIFFSTPITLKNGEVAGVLRAQFKSDILFEYFRKYLETEDIFTKKIFVALFAERAVKQISPDDPSSVFIMLSNGSNSVLNFMSATPLTTNVITPLQMSRFLPVGSTAQLSLDVPGLDEGLRNADTAPIFKAQAFPREDDSKLPLDIIAVARVKEENLSWSVIVSESLDTFNTPFQRQNETNIIVAIAIAIGAIFFAYIGSQYLTRPIIELANTADQVAQGDLNKRAIVTTEDEVGELGTAFNSMTNQLNLLIASLEDRITERTQALERSEGQLRAAVQVGKAAASLRNLDELLNSTTELISQQFDFYHAGIFLIDAYGEYALLTAANSEGGHRMLAREHKLKVGAEGIVGYVTSTGEARIALDVGRDAAYFDNPDLPHTRSEMALPLIAGGKILGALDIQSTEGEAFSEADIASLQVLADQIAIAIENARLFEESRRSLATAQRAYGEQSQLGWQELIHQRENYGYRSTPDGSIFPLEKDSLDEVVKEKDLRVDDDGTKVAIPIMVRGESVGTIRLKKESNAPSWEEKDLDLVNRMTEELSRAMDSARLFDEAKKQADRERVVGEISDKMRETMNVESVIRLAADELYKLLELEQVTIHLNPDEDQRNEESA